jgi:hypothetical protein
VLNFLTRLVVATSTLATLLVSTPAAQAGFEPAAETLELSHLPSWVQVATDDAPLYVSDTGRGTTGPRIPRWTFLQVLGGATQRLQVAETNDRGQVVRQGWVDPERVRPSASGRDWLVTSAPATLWKGGDSTASRTLDPFTPMQQTNGPVGGRIEVRVYRADLQAVIDYGWIDQAATGPAFAPASLVPDPVGGAPLRANTSGIDQRQVFLNSAARAAMSASARTGVPASVTVAQAILESDWGRSTLAQYAGNYFGIKATGGLGNDGVVWMPTVEYDADGQVYETISAFRAYRTLTDSLIDHDLLLRGASRYAPAMQARHDPRQFAQLLAEAGYATDPEYADKVIALMDRYDLYRLDA